MKFKVIIKEGEDGWYVVEVPSLPGCISQGKTIEEALENIKGLKLPVFSGIQVALRQALSC